MASIPQVNSNMQLQQVQKNNMQKTAAQRVFENVVKSPAFWAALITAGSIAGIIATVAVAPWVAPIVIPVLVAAILITLVATLAAHAPRRHYTSPVYVAPRPVYIAPRPVVYPRPAPIIVPVPVRPHYPHHHYGHHHHHHHHHGRRW